MHLKGVAMLNFRNDYAQVGHPKVIQALVDHGKKIYPGYGTDQACQEAKEKIWKALGQERPIYFLPGGTIANALAMTFQLRPYEGVVTPKTGHIVDHEAGSMEALGCKLLYLEEEDGKISPEALEVFLSKKRGVAQVLPRVVYISNTTELGTVYSKEDLEKIYRICKNHDVYLFLDGARLGSALAAEKSQLSFKDLPDLCDFFTIGGTKNGALFGEALVFNREDLAHNFDRYMKQRGVLTAKSFLLGLQFSALFTGDLYMENARWANARARDLSQGLVDLGLSLAYPPESNQIFVLYPKEKIADLEKLASFEEDGERDGQAILRFVTAYHTREEDVEGLLKAIKDLAC